MSLVSARSSIVAAAVATAAATLTLAAPARAATTSPDWVAGWAAPQLDFGTLTGLVPHYEEAGGLTLRNVVRMSAGGRQARVRLSNRFGTRPVTFDSVTLARSAGGAALVPGSVRTLRFGGKQRLTLKPGTETTSDAVTLTLPAPGEVAVTLYSSAPTGRVTADAGGRLHASYIASQGDASASTSAAPFTETVHARYYVAGVDVPATRARSGTLVALGDSILAGYNSTADANRGWVDVLTRRVGASSLPLSVVNEGIAGDNLHEDTRCYGESILTRLERDAIDVPGTRAVFLSIGANDITHPEQPDDGCIARRKISAAGMIALYKKVVARLHACGIRVYTTPIMPFGAYRFWSAAIEAKRVAINRWIRTGKAYDGIVDFDKVLADPSDPTRIAAGYDSGDGLHPSDAGHAAMGRAIPLSLFNAKRLPSRGCGS